MIYEYKIQKIVDGNGDESFNILTSRVSNQKWWKKKNWRDLDRYPSESRHASLRSAQAVVKENMELDTSAEHMSNKKKITVMKEYKYTEIPKHIPEEQEEKFCDLKGVTS